MPTSLLTVTPLTASGISHVFDNFPNTGVVLWLDATKIAGITSGTSLSAWTDSSASASHALQASAGSQPAYLTNQQNGLAVVSWPAGNRAFLVSQTSLKVGMTVAVAAKSVTTTGSQALVGGSSALYEDGTNWIVFGGNNIATSAYTSNTWITMIGIYSGSSTTGSVSGVTAFGNAGANSQLSLNIGNFTIGVPEYLNGQIGEIIAYNRSISEVERASLETYLRTKWSTL